MHTGNYGLIIAVLAVYALYVLNPFIAAQSLIASTAESPAHSSLLPSASSLEALLLSTDSVRCFVHVSFPWPKLTRHFSSWTSSSWWPRSHPEISLYWTLRYWASTPLVCLPYLHILLARWCIIGRHSRTRLCHRAWHWERVCYRSGYCLRTVQSRGSWGVNSIVLGGRAQSVRSNFIIHQGLFDIWTYSAISLCSLCILFFGNCSKPPGIEFITICSSRNKRKREK